jgi:hypothetical protein
VKDTEKKKKKEKKQSEENQQEHQNNDAQNTLTEASDAVEKLETPKDKRKKKKLKKAHSTSTTTIPEVSIFNEQLGNPQGVNNDEPQGPPQEKLSEHNNESSNSCLRPSLIKVFSKLFLCLKIFV